MSHNSFLKRQRIPIGKICTYAFTSCEVIKCFNTNMMVLSYVFKTRYSDYLRSFKSLSALASFFITLIHKWRFYKPVYLKLELGLHCGFPYVSSLIISVSCRPSLLTCYVWRRDVTFSIQTHFFA